jgi:hypothetical protein
MDFSPRISASLAKLLMKREVPRDARVIADARKRTCEQIQYRSATLKRLLGYPKVGVEFSSTFAGGRYRGVVRFVIINQYLSTKEGC